MHQRHIERRVNRSSVGETQQEAWGQKGKEKMFFSFWWWTQVMNERDNCWWRQERMSEKSGSKYMNLCWNHKQRVVSLEVSHIFSDFLFLHLFSTSSPFFPCISCISSFFLTFTSHTKGRLHLQFPVSSFIPQCIRMIEVVTLCEKRRMPSSPRIYCCYWRIPFSPQQHCFSLRLGLERVTRKSHSCLICHTGRRRPREQ